MHLNTMYRFDPRKGFWTNDTIRPIKMKRNKWICNFSRLGNVHKLQVPMIIEGLRFDIIALLLHANAV